MIEASLSDPDASMAGSEAPSQERGPPEARRLRLRRKGRPEARPQEVSEAPPQEEGPPEEMGAAVLLEVSEAPPSPEEAPPQEVPEAPPSSEEAPAQEATEAPPSQDEEIPVNPPLLWLPPWPPALDSQRAEAPQSARLALAKITSRAARLGQWRAQLLYVAHLERLLGAAPGRLLGAPSSPGEASALKKELNEYLRRSPGRGWLEHQIANGENELARLSEDLLKRFAGPS